MPAQSRSPESQGALPRFGEDRETFLAHVSHELRSPLNSIRGWAHLLRKGGPLSAVQQHALDAIERSVATQSRLIEDLLDSQRQEDLDEPLRIQPMALETVVEEAVDVIRPAADERRQDLHVSVPPARLDADPDRLRQVLVNLLSNAVKFTPPWGRIALTADVQGERLAIEVTDSGIGLAPDWGQDGACGPGLGLTVAHCLVERHGGRMSARSDGPGRGSTFRIELPVEAAAGSDRPMQPGQDQPVP